MDNNRKRRVNEWIAPKSKEISAQYSSLTFVNLIESPIMLIERERGERERERKREFNGRISETIIIEMSSDLLGQGFCTSLREKRKHVRT